MLTQMQVRGLMFDPYTNAYIVVLRDEGNSEMLPIWVGKPEASSINFAMEGVATPRPMTHDLMKTVLDTADAKIISVVVTDLKENVLRQDSSSLRRLGIFHRFPAERCDRPRSASKGSDLRDRRRYPEA